jgi:hypothetical protein
LKISSEFKVQLSELMKSNPKLPSLIEYFENISESVIPKDSTFDFSCKDFDKPTRTQFHQLIKTHCPQFESTTVVD